MFMDTDFSWPKFARRGHMSHISHVSHVSHFKWALHLMHASGMDKKWQNNVTNMSSLSNSQGKPTVKPFRGEANRETLQTVLLHR